MDKEKVFYLETAIEIIKNIFNIAEPTERQIEMMTSLLFHAWLKHRIILNEKLSTQEKRYLLFASKGKTYVEIAELLNVSTNTARDYEKEILRKLCCSNMKEALVVGIRYGAIAIPEKI